VPDPAQPSELAGDEQGRLTRLEQGGWVIDYPAYGQVAALELPTRIQAQRDQIKVKLVIEQWNLQP
jgi:outer membrane lipoprotein LolB